MYSSSSDYSDDDASLGAYEEDVMAQEKGEIPAKTRRQGDDQRRMDTRIKAFLDQHPFGRNEKAWKNAHGWDAHGALLGEFWEWCMSECSQDGFSKLSMITLENGDSKMASVAIRKLFPHFELQSHTIKSLRNLSPAFEEKYVSLSQSCGGPKASIKHARPMFHVDAEFLIDSTDPTASGIRMTAFIAVWRDTGINAAQM